MLVASGGTNRMDVLYNDSTKKVCHGHEMETPGAEWCNRGIATSTSPTGPFTKLFDSTVYGVNTGDMSVFKDDDGKRTICMNYGTTENDPGFFAYDAGLYQSAKKDAAMDQ